jgi:hypothetical protein
MNRHRLALAARTALVLGMLAAGSGCVSARAYFHDRWADAKDIFTASVGTGPGGVMARVGPVNAGFFYNSDWTGLRAGEFFNFPSDFRERMAQRCAGEIGIGLVWGEGFGNSLSLKEACERKKSYEWGGVLIPIVYSGVPASCYTQIEVAAGIAGTLRLGFNPGELLDFLLGWTTLDIYGDDLQARKEREEAEKKAEEKEKSKEPPAPPATPAAPPSGNRGTGP